MEKEGKSILRKKRSETRKKFLSVENQRKKGYSFHLVFIRDEFQKNKQLIFQFVA